MNASGARRVARQIGAAWRECGDLRTTSRLAADIFVAKAHRILGKAGGRQRHVQLRDGTVITYRMNPGDVQSVREIWLDQIYRLPSGFRPKRVLDIGANIGMASVYFWRRCGAEHIVAVEPSPENCRLAELNMSLNHMNSDIVAAALGARDGSGRFQPGIASNTGRLSESGITVPVLSMETVLHRTGWDRVDLLKMDIEGTEEEVLAGDLAWLEVIGAVSIEFHPEVNVNQDLAPVLVAAGFDRIPAGRLGPHSVELFMRR